MISDKSDEALKVMPVIFDENEYNTVVCDPPYAGYQNVPDLSIFSEYENIKAYITDGFYFAKDENKLEVLNRKLFCFGFTRVMPNVFFNLLYDDGNYNNISLQKKAEIDNFIDWIEVLAHLKEMTYFTDSKGSFLLIQNSSTHEPIYLFDDYSYSTTDYDDKKYDNVTMNKKSLYNDSIVLNGTNGSESQIAHYQVNMAAIMQLGEWFDYLKENDLYDNTRIIIVSDHGRGLGLFDDLVTENDDYMLYNALLLYEDFNSKGFQKDEAFMTNADVVYLATEGLIESPTNPFTGKEIKKEINTGEYHVFGTDQWNILKNNGTTFIKDKWYSVHDNCLDPDNWNSIDDPCEK